MRSLDKLRALRPTPSQTTDPVCHMTIDPQDAAGQSEHAGRTVYFCSAGCKRRFDAEPAKFLSG